VNLISSRVEMQEIILFVSIIFHKDLKILFVWISLGIYNEFLGQCIEFYTKIV